MYYSCFPSPLGNIHIRATDTGVLAISFMESPPVEQNENDLTRIVAAQLQEYFDGKRLKFDFPIEQEGTAFQQEVWKNLMDIPAGKPISYTALSKRMNNPLAIRAIAAANGRNNVAIAVPCHRVIGRNGELVGYAGELWRKKWLLEHEIKITQTGQSTLF